MLEVAGKQASVTVACNRQTASKAARQAGEHRKTVRNMENKFRPFGLPTGS